MDESCVFCRIIAGQIPATFVHRDDDLIVIADAHPVAPTHVLVIPTEHWPTLADFVAGADAATVAKYFATVARLSRDVGAGGSRVVVNTGADGGQTVDHLHAHVLAGRRMTWPPG